MASDLDLDLREVLGRSASRQCEVARETLDASTSRLANQRLVDVSVRTALTADFARVAQAWAGVDFDFFRACMVEIGLPWNLNAIEIAMYEAAPEHPYFRPLQRVERPKGLGVYRLNHTYDVYYVFDVVRAYHQRRRLSERRDFGELRDRLERLIEQSFDEIPLGPGGHLMTSLLKRWDVDRAHAKHLLSQPLARVIDEQIWARNRQRAGDHPVMTQLHRLAETRGESPPSKMPARYYMTSSFWALTLKWTKYRRAQFRSMMARAGLPVNLNFSEMDAFGADPLDRVFSPLSAVPDLDPVLDNTSEVYFVIDALKAFESEEPHPFAASHLDVKRKAIQRYLGPSFPRSLSPAKAIGAGNECDAYLGTVSDEAFAAEANRRLAEGRLRLTKGGGVIGGR